MKTLHVYLLVLVAVLASSLIAFSMQAQELTTDEKIAMYYEAETAAVMSTHELTELLAAGEDVAIVDLRAKGAYDSSHVYGAINVDASVLSDEELATRFRELQSQHDTVVMYCYHQHCMLASNTGVVLARQGVYVQELNIGFAELALDDALMIGDIAVAPCSEGERGC